jgi:hypothetical protein
LTKKVVETQRIYIMLWFVKTQLKWEVSFHKCECLVSMIGQSCVGISRPQGITTRDLMVANENLKLLNENLDQSRSSLELRDPDFTCLTDLLFLEVLWSLDVSIAVLYLTIFNSYSMNHTITVKRMVSIVARQM